MAAERNEPGFFGACIISARSRYISARVDQTTELGKIILVYLLLENVVTSEKRLRTVMFMIVIGGLFPALGTINHYRAGIFIERTRAAWRGLFANPNEDAYALLILIPIALGLASASRRMIRIALWGVVATYLLAIFLTFSRGGYIALFAVLAVMAWKQKSIVMKAGCRCLDQGLLLLPCTERRSGDSRTLNKDTNVKQRLATFKPVL